jgi:hypothetical protein
MIIEYAMTRDRDVNLEEELIEVLLNIHDSYEMNKYDLRFNIGQARHINHSVSYTVTYLRDLKTKDREQLISSLDSDILDKLSCVINKGLASSYKIIRC